MKYAVIDPATNEQIKEYWTSTDAEIESALAKAQSAYRDWSRNTSLTERTTLLRAVGKLHLERRDLLARIVHQEMGKSMEQAYIETDFVAGIYEYYADNAEKFFADEPIELLGGEGTALIRRSAVGPLLGIMPWNYPYYQTARFAAPNVLAGNPVMVKPAEQCPESAAEIQKMFLEAGFPQGMFQTIYATKEQVADIIADVRVQGVSLTGSETAGAAVAEIAGRNLKKVVLELGGSDPFLLLSTDDIDASVDAAFAGRFENNGQACNAAKRLIVMDNIYDEFLAKFTKKVLDPTNETVPLSSIAAATRLSAQVEQAVKDGGTLVSAGELSGAFYPPSVLSDVPADSPVHQQELFGPVALVYRVSTEEEAVSIANNTPFGLGSYVYTSDSEQAARVADQLEAGMVFVNLVHADTVELPFGGVKRSGFGRELGRYGADEFVNKKLIRVG